MKTRRLIDGASFGPETLKAMGEAFDQARARIATNFPDTPLQTENARLRRAEATRTLSRSRLALFKRRPWTTARAFDRLG